MTCSRAPGTCARFNKDWIACTWCTCVGVLLLCLVPLVASHSRSRSRTTLSHLGRLPELAAERPNSLRRAREHQRHRFSEAVSLNTAHSEQRGSLRNGIRSALSAAASAIPSAASVDAVSQLSGQYGAAVMVRSRYHRPLAHAYMHCKLALTLVYVA